MRSASSRILSAALTAVLLLPATLSACPLCKDALEDPGGVPNQVGRGFYYSILLMMSAPFLLVGGLILKIVVARRRKERAAQPAALVPEPPGARF
ncbi:MAG TPA: hypothetical protein VIB08_00965 [Thermoanaerobaculia bacterium]|jgi:hypothetical protein